MNKHTVFWIVFHCLIFGYIGWELSIYLSIDFLLLVLIHEFGHYLVSRYEGNFKGFMFDHGSPAVVSIGKHRNRFAYLGGLVANLITFPIYLLMPIDLSKILLILACTFLGAFADIMKCIRWKAKE